MKKFIVNSLLMSLMAFSMLVGGFVTDVNATCYGVLFFNSNSPVSLTEDCISLPSGFSYDPVTGKLYIPSNININGNDLLPLNLGIGSTSILGGSNTYLLYNNNGILGNESSVPITNGGTGQVTANAGLNALLPNQSGNSGLFLQSDGTNSTWATITSGSPFYDESGNLQVNIHTVIIKSILIAGTGGSPTAVNLSGSAVFTSSNSYGCVAEARGDTIIVNITSYDSGSQFHAITTWGNSTAKPATFICIGN